MSTVIPTVGMGGTQNVGSDRYPFTIVQVLSPTRCVIQRDAFTRTEANGQSESQSYTFAPDPTAKRIEISLRKNRRWYRTGDPMAPMLSFTLGQRRAYFDPSF